MSSVIHISDVGTYHPADGSDVAWTVHDTRGYIDGGPPCDSCGKCECGECEECGETACQIGINDDGYCGYHGDPDVGVLECIGLSFAYVCLDGGDALCEDCFEQEKPATVIPCDCA